MKSLNIISKIGFCAIFYLLLSGCGFHLRHSPYLDLGKKYHQIEVIYTQVPPSWKIIMREKLIAAHIAIASKPHPKSYRLTIENEQIERHILSISSGSSSRQYQLSYQIRFSFEQTQNKIYIEEAPVLVTRFLTINNNRILGSHDEEEKILQEMRQDAASQILNRLSILKINSPH